VINSKKYAVYYRDIPLILHHFISKDGNITVAKDGVHRIDGQACPRITLTVQPIANMDKERLRRLEELLEELAVNNQIAGWA
jgi:hypothetical protein